LKPAEVFSAGTFLGGSVLNNLYRVSFEAVRSEYLDGDIKKGEVALGQHLAKSQKDVEYLLRVGAIEAVTADEPVTEPNPAAIEKPKPAPKPRRSRKAA
jgi:hypothetical protein